MMENIINAAQSHTQGVKISITILSEPLGSHRCTETCLIEIERRSLTPSLSHMDACKQARDATFKCTANF